MELLYGGFCPATYPTTAVLIERNTPCHAKRCRSPYILLWARRPKAVRSISAARTLFSCATRLTDISESHPHPIPLPEGEGISLLKHKKRQKTKWCKAQKAPTGI